VQHLSMMSVALLWFTRPQAESWVGRIQVLPAQAVDVEDVAVVVVDILDLFVCLFGCVAADGAVRMEAETFSFFSFFFFEDRIG